MPDGAVARAADVEAQVVAMVQRTVDELERVDILVNNAGGTRMGPLRTPLQRATESWKVAGAVDGGPHLGGIDDV